MPYSNISQLPNAFNNFSSEEKKKAMRMLNSLLKQGMEEVKAIRITLSSIKKSRKEGEMELDSQGEEKEETTEEEVVEESEAIEEEPQEEKEEIKLIDTELQEEADLIAINEDNKNSYLIKVIQPGWGSSGYYSEELLEREAAKFSSGTKMYVDHAKEGETSRSVKDLAGVFKSEAKYMDDGPDGKGLYAEIEVFDSFEPYLNEIAPHIGVSIFASGVAEHGEVEGKEGPIIKEFTKVLATDFVDRPGAGGKILAKLNEARDEIEKLHRKVTESEAVIYCMEAMSDIKLPEASRKKIVDSVMKAEADKFEEAYEVALQEQLEYIKEIEEDKSPVKDMSDSEDRSVPTIEETQKKLFEVFKNMGLSEEAALEAAKGRD